jgi:peptide/nickel transport system permease protein
MARYAVRRLLAGLLLLFAMTVLTFALFRLVPLPTGCLIVPCGPGTTTNDAQLRAAAHQLGTDRPVIVQYAKFIWGIVRHGSFGSSWIHGNIDASIRQAIPPTLSVLVGGALVLLLLSIPLGVLSATRAQQPLDRLILSFSIVGIALHPFIVGLLLKRVFSGDLHALPLGGFCHPFNTPPPDTSIVVNGPNGPQPLQPCVGVLPWAQHMILPWLTFALFFLPLYTRMVRARVLETLDASHVAAARAKGASEVRVLRSHVLRPALLPILTMVGLDLGGALMASMYIESMYGLGGFGSLMLNTIGGGGANFGYDLPLVAAMFFVIAVCVILLNLVVDLLYGWLDPRVHLA